jgi:peptidoglycan/xylan/chitin deacetylase (PgdA/CDA1 family)
MPHKGVFLITLDTEMLWGHPSPVVDGIALEGKGCEVREAISTLLDLFEVYRIPATWAVVGHLCLDECSKGSCLTSRNIEKYGYVADDYRDPYSDIQKEPLYYGSDIIEAIRSSQIPHDIGSHSFSHPRFTAMTRAMAEAEVKEARRVLDDLGIEAVSFVFPYNEVSYVDIIAKYGFKIYRGRIPARSGPHRIVPPSVRPKWGGLAWELPGSMYFHYSRVPGGTLLRAKLGLDKAIRSDSVFHLFLHPWNLLVNDQLREQLSQFLAYVSGKRERGEITVATMGDLGHSSSARDETIC